MTETRTRIRVDGTTAYDVVVGRDIVADTLPSMLDGVATVALIHARSLADRATRIQTVVTRAGMHCALIPVPDGETAKELVIAAEVWDALADSRVSRTDAVLSLGGGATTDLAGFVAATWLRGVRVVHLPTTLLAMVDAAIGGKTAVNTRAGKNLVGVFHQPHGVICELSTLLTVPP